MTPPEAPRTPGARRKARLAARHALIWRSLDQALQAELLAMTPEQLAETRRSAVYVRSIGAEIVQRRGADWLRGLE